MSDLLSRTVQSNLGGCQAMHHKPKHSTHHSPADSTDAHAKSHRWLLPVLLVAQLMVILDITAVNIALPHIAMDLKMSGSTISWTITSYSLIFGSLLLFGGRAADLLGRRRMFVTGLGVFTASSFDSAMAGSAAMLFASRAGQGLGAAILSPAALSIITAAYQGSRRAKGLAAFAIYELHIDKPLLRVERIADRAVGGGLVLMLAVAGTIFGLFLLCSLYLQNVLGWGPLTTGLAFVPLALSAGIGSHAAGHVISKHGVRGQIGGTLGIAIFSTIAAGSGAILGPQAASGIGDAFLVAALVASLASVMALALLPRAQHFLAKLALNPQAMPVH